MSHTLVREGLAKIGARRCPHEGLPLLVAHASASMDDLRHGVAVEVLEQRHDLEEVRALVGHARIDTTQLYTMIRPPQLKRAVGVYEAQAERILADGREDLIGSL